MLLYGQCGRSRPCLYLRPSPTVREPDPPWERGRASWGSIPAQPGWTRPAGPSAQLRTRTTPAGRRRSRDTDGHGSVAACRVVDQSVAPAETDCGSASGIPAQPKDERETLVLDEALHFSVPSLGVVVAEAGPPLHGIRARTRFSTSSLTTATPSSLHRYRRRGVRRVSVPSRTGGARGRGTVSPSARSMEPGCVEWSRSTLPASDVHEPFVSSQQAARAHGRSVCRSSRWATLRPCWGGGRGVSERRQPYFSANDCPASSPADALASGREPVLLPRLLLKKEVAEILRYRSVRSIERLITRGELEVVQVTGRQVRIEASSLAAFLERRTRRASRAAAPSGASSRTSFATIEPESLSGPQS